jgi:signal transduction histidine kinase
MSLESSWRLTKARFLSGEGVLLRCVSLLLLVAVLVLANEFSASAQARPKKNVLILNEVGLSHALTDIMTQQIVGGVQETPERHVEFYSESIDLLSFPGKPSLADTRDWLVKKYGDHTLDVVVAVGPDTIRFLAEQTQPIFSGASIVICGSSADMAGTPRLDSRFTGTWQKLEPAKAMEVALRLFPNTRHVFVVSGTSTFDRIAETSTKDSLRSVQRNVEFTYLTDMEMNRLLGQLQKLPENSIVFYISFFQDSAGNRFVNATQALPMVAEAAKAPIFGMSDTYLGHGIVGGDLMSFREQGKATARIVSQLLDGRKAAELPIETISSVYMFDWNELRRWHIPESHLPSGSIIMFREPSLWERTRWMWVTAFLIISGLSTLAIYLQHSRKQLGLARESQRQLSGMLISAGEQERRRVASELHDDFSQRLAVMALKLENVAEKVSPLSQEADQQLQELVNSTSELGADLHSLSHRLHSSTLESLGLLPAVSALCKEFTAQQAVEVNFMSDGVPRSVHPDVALCVFRIVQEGLRNLKRHSGATTALVSLHCAGDRLTVSVFDKGCGFDAGQLRGKEGLGLRSMKERAHSLGGKFEIHSEPGKGTTLEAWVPLDLREGHDKDKRDDGF